MAKLVGGIGVYEGGKYACTLGGVITKEYALWRDMLTRCYSPKYQARCPTYIGCTVSENFKNFQFFAEWCNQQIGFGLKGYHLDKDILVNGNKVYSEDTCVFVPQPLNKLLLTCEIRRGQWPLGVSYHKGHDRYGSQMSKQGKVSHFGWYETPEAAFSVYKTNKELYIKEVASRFKSNVDARVYQALLEYQV